jgi:hypothetical protein
MARDRHQFVRGHAGVSSPPHAALLEAVQAATRRQSGFG